MLKRAILILMALVSMAGFAWAESITVVADEWCPYNCEPGSSQPGFGIEIMQQAFSAKGIKVEYSIMDWDKAIAEARKGKYNAIIGAYKEDAPDFVFPDNEFGLSTNMFFVSKDDKWRFTGANSLKGRKVGIIKGYSYGEELDAFFKNNPKDSFVTDNPEPLKVLSQKLIDKQIDTILEDNFVFLLKSREYKLFGKVVSAGGEGEASPVYIAFSPANKDSAKHAKILSDGIAQLRSSGKLKEILKKYGIDDWRK